MTGRIQAALKKEGKCLVWRVAVLLLYFGGLVNYFQIEKNSSISVFLSDFFPAAEQVREILDEEEYAKSREDLCFLYQGGFVHVTEEEYNRQAEVEAVGIMGNAQLYDFRAVGFAPEDDNGCLIDRETAEKLFGTATAVGRTVAVMGTVYEVRAVIPWKQPLFLYHPDDENVRFTKLLIQKNQQTNIESQVNQILVKYGLGGKIVEDGTGRRIAFLALLAVPAALLAKLFAWALAEQRKHKKKELIFWAWEGIFLFFFLVFAFWLWNTVKLPKDWIPGKWSDFQFYQDKWKELSRQAQLSLALPKTALQAENMIFLCKSLVESVLSFIFLCLNFHRFLGKLY